MNLLHKLKITVAAFAVLNSQIVTGNNSFLEMQKINGSDANNFSEFGYASDIEGNWAVIGAPQNGNGAVHVFKRQGDTWLESQKITSSDVGLNDFFGASVAIDGNKMLIGAPDDDNNNGSNAGAAYYFEYNGTSWVERQKITSSISESNSQFGAAVSLSGNRAVVSIPNILRGFNGSMVVYQFNGENWAFQSEITSPSTATVSQSFNWRYSRKLKIHNDLIAVSDLAEDDKGAVYIFEFVMGTWLLQQRLSASDAVNNQKFGTSISLQDNAIAIGAGGDNADSGAVFVFSNASTLLWTEQVKLTASDSIAGDFFGGTDIVLKGDSLLVGSYQSGISGAAYLFQNQATGWQEVQKIAPSDGDFDDQFGLSLAMDTDHILVGARYEDDNGMNSGSAYIYLSDLIFTGGFE